MREDRKEAQSRPATEQAYLVRAVEIAVRLGILSVLVLWCYTLVRPFITPFAWGVIIAVASYNGYRRIVAACGGRTRLGAACFVLVGLLAVLGPVVLLSGSLVDGVQAIAARADAGSLAVPPPPQAVGQLPVVGGTIERYWTLASQNLNAALAEVKPQLKALAGFLLARLAGTGFALLQFVVSIFIAAVLLARADACARAAQALGKRLAGARGVDLIGLAGSTIRGVTRGILGVAVIQATMAGLGFVVAGIPGAGLLAFFCLLLAVIQLGPAIILLPTVIYVFSTAATLPAVVYAVWCVVVALSDNVLKPLLLGRGAKVPTLVLFIGAIGGFLAEGIVGLFVGSVVLAIGHELFVAWLESSDDVVVAAPPSE